MPSMKPAPLAVYLATLFLAGCSGSDNAPEAQATSASDNGKPETVAEAPPSQGKLLFLQCAACHAVDAEAPAKVGPHLSCVVGRTAGAVEDFKYSQAFRDAAAQGLTWERDTLLQFIMNPRDLVPNNAMAFGGVADSDRATQVIDYLEQECSNNAG